MMRACPCSQLKKLGNDPAFWPSILVALEPTDKASAYLSLSIYGASAFLGQPTDSIFMTTSPLQPIEAIRVYVSKK